MVSPIPSGPAWPREASPPMPWRAAICQTALDQRVPPSLARWREAYNALRWVKILYDGIKQPHRVELTLNSPLHESEFDTLTARRARWK
jgi:hypothetical protein